MNSPCRSLPAPACHRPARAHHITARVTILKVCLRSAPTGRPGPASPSNRASQHRTDYTLKTDVVFHQLAGHAKQPGTLSSARSVSFSVRARTVRHRGRTFARPYLFDFKNPISSFASWSVAVTTYHGGPSATSIAVSARPELDQIAKYAYTPFFSQASPEACFKIIRPVRIPFIIAGLILQHRSSRFLFMQCPLAPGAPARPGPRFHEVSRHSAPREAISFCFSSSAPVKPESAACVSRLFRFERRSFPPDIFRYLLQLRQPFLKTRFGLAQPCAPASDVQRMLSASIRLVFFSSSRS